MKGRIRFCRLQSSNCAAAAATDFFASETKHGSKFGAERTAATPIVKICGADDDDIRERGNNIYGSRRDTRKRGRL